MKYCGRQFEIAELEHIRALINQPKPPSRYKLSLTTCEHLNWRRSDGKLKDMSCRVALLRMEADGLIKLPPPRWAKPVTYGRHPDIEDEVNEPTTAPIIDLDCISAHVVEKQRDSRLRNAYVQRYHYLGHQLMPGAQLRYFVHVGSERVALLSFGASAWKTGPRDTHIGWSPEQRKRNLHLVVNNARFLIFPWIRCPNLASKSLALVARQLRRDWEVRYSYSPVLLETFVEDGRYRGICYKAANWLCLGKTQGRGKLDRYHRNAAPVKSVWVQPLVPDFRQQLCK